MELPILLKTEIERRAAVYPYKRLQAASQALTDRYLHESGQGKRLVKNEVEAVAYAAARMPATYGAVFAALQSTLGCFDGEITSVLDIGAGTGAASWAAAQLTNAASFVCLEREETMLALGKQLAGCHPTLQGSRWVRQDLTAAPLSEHADLVIASYALGELNEETRVRVWDALWQAADKLLVIIEPGTPVGFGQIRAARDYLREHGGTVAAPCPHGESCPLEEDWCQFACRVARSKLHKQLKGGDAPYEDEKFSFVALAKTGARPVQARILRHPLKEPGRIALRLCTADGLQTQTVTKKQGALFKQARKASGGDAFEE